MALVTFEWDEDKHPRVPAGSPEGGEFEGDETQLGDASTAGKEWGNYATAIETRWAADVLLGVHHVGDAAHHPRVGKTGVSKETLNAIDHDPNTDPKAAAARDRALTLLSAVAAAPPTTEPLLRDMTVDRARDRAALEKLGPGSAFDISLASFGGEKAGTSYYLKEGAPADHNFELRLEPGAKAWAVPSSKGLDNIVSGRFEVVGVEHSPGDARRFQAPRTVITIRQKGTFDPSSGRLTAAAGPEYVRPTFWEIFDPTPSAQTAYGSSDGELLDQVKGHARRTGAPVADGTAVLPDGSRISSEPLFFLRDVARKDVTAAGVVFEFDPNEPRNAKGEWDSAGGEGGAAGAQTLPTTKQQLRDQIVGLWKEKFLADLGDYPQRYQEAARSGAPEPHSENAAQVDYWRYEHGMRKFPMDVARVKAFVEDDKQALGTMRRQATKVAGSFNIDAVRPLAAERAQQAVDWLRSDPRVQALEDRYGTPTFRIAATTQGTALDSLDTPSGNFDPYLKVVTAYDNAFDRTGEMGIVDGKYQVVGTGEKPLELGALRPGSATVDESHGGGSYQGVYTHEFGHFVDFQLPAEKSAEFDRLFAARKAAYEEEWARANALPTEMQKMDAREAAAAKTISYYSLNSGRPNRGDRQEGFAETFAAVMHPSYNRNLYDSSNHAMLAWMENLVRGA